MWSWALKIAGALSCPCLLCLSVDFHRGLGIEDRTHSFLQVLLPHLALPPLHDVHCLIATISGDVRYVWHVHAISYRRKKVSFEPLTWGVAG